MDKVISLLEIVVPILVCIGLGILARKKAIITPSRTGACSSLC